MASRNDTEVIIGGKVFTLSGSESEEYMQKVASYINNKIAEYNKLDSFKRQPLDTQNILMQLNIADDYFKAKSQVTTLEEEIEKRDKEIYDLKHELIASQIKTESVEKSALSIREELVKAQKRMSQLEASHEKRKKPAEPAAKVQSAQSVTAEPAAKASGGKTVK